MNLRWNSFLRLSLMNVLSWLSGSALEQFLNTTSSSQRFLIFMSPLPSPAYFSLRKEGKLKNWYPWAVHVQVHRTQNRLSLT